MISDLELGKRPPPTLLEAAAAFEWLREQALKPGAPAEAGHALDAWFLAAKASVWTPLKVRKPQDGQLIVKRWVLTGAVWAGVYRDRPKHDGFDEWKPL